MDFLFFAHPPPLPRTPEVPEETISLSKNISTGGGQESPLHPCPCSPTLCWEGSLSDWDQSRRGWRGRSLFSVEKPCSPPSGGHSWVARPLGVQHVSTSSPQTSTVSSHPLTLGLPSASLTWLQTLVGQDGCYLDPVIWTPPNSPVP